MEPILEGNQDRDTGGNRSAEHSVSLLGSRYLAAGRLEKRLGRGGGRGDSFDCIQESGGCGVLASETREYRGKRVVSYNGVVPPLSLSLFLFSSPSISPVRRGSRDKSAGRFSRRIHRVSYTPTPPLGHPSPFLSSCRPSQLPFARPPTPSDPYI